MVSSRAAGTGAAANSLDAPEWVVFACSGHRFAVPLRVVREILPPRPFTRLPGCGPAVCGLVGLRGRVVTVVDLGALLLGRPAAASPAHRLLLVEHGGRLVGAAVETVVGVARGAAPELAIPGEALRALDGGREDVVGVGALDGRPFVALDAGAILDRLLT